MKRANFSAVLWLALVSGLAVAMPSMQAQAVESEPSRYDALKVEPASDGSAIALTTEPSSDLTTVSEVSAPGSEAPMASDAIATEPVAETEQAPGNGVALQDWRTTQTATTRDTASTLSAVQATMNMAQVTSVTQFSDVQPGDWAYEALSFLANSEDQGGLDCLEGYPDGSYRGNRTLSRFEFAAGLAACLDAIAGTNLDAEQITRVEALQREFSAELTALRGRVDTLEAQVDELEANQFSTTTRLFGQAVVGVQGRNENDFTFFVDELTDDETSVNLITNLQLSLLTQFDERTILLTGLQAGDGGTVEDGPALSNFFRLGYEGDTDNDFRLSDLSLRHLIGDDFAIIVGAEGLNAVNVFRGTNRVEGAGLGPLSLFAQRNPIIGMGNGEGGLGFDWQIADRISLQGVYSSSLPSDTNLGGLFGGDQGETAIGAQLVVTPIDNLDVSFQYINSYSPFGRLGTGVGDDQIAVLGGNFRAPINTDALGTSLAWQISNTFSLGGWFGYTNSDLQGDRGNAETINWMVFLNVADVLGDGNLAGLYVGQPPRIVSSDFPGGRNVPSFINEGEVEAGSGGQPDAATHLEGFFRWRLSDNIVLTPGFIVIFNPGHNSDNDTIFVGALRTTFLF
ncbi:MULTISPECIES: iron uptake porin [unclassified Leptolyngbya]|uniref:iron uptake porin n=1 Tax=unclassified Leptolyngbya TaxID=2650499 RepID=UPI0016859C7D|nr:MULTISPECIES: iron uptake porin [unclassified Leptolyngbya]MBD1910769.1 carbohydrate porin [Leptolyngbya sp. FACHB-8]MBD2158845.1 carbohydrate porin [Leptolyngbya sp. FACHB-16]